MTFTKVLEEGIMGIVQDEEKTREIMTICETVAHYSNPGIPVPLIEAADGEGKEYDTLKNMAMWLLTESNALNVIHWNTDRLSKHELLNEAYELCRDTGDQLAEAYIAIMDKDIEVTEAPKFPSTSKNDSDVLAHLKNIQARMQEALEKNDNFGEGVKNIFADFDEKITTIIYKWSRFAV